jgi:hypothetical protein
MQTLLSIIGLYNYDPTIFDGIKQYLPTAPLNPEYALDSHEPIDFDTLINKIMFRAGELSLVYTDPDTVKLMLTMWAKSCSAAWQRLYDTVWLKYDPLFGRVREYSLKRDSKDKSNLTDSTSQTDTRGIERTDMTETVKDGKKVDTFKEQRDEDIETNANNEGTENNIDVHYEQAYNDVGSNFWHEKTKDTHEGKSKETGYTKSTDGEHTESTTNSKTDDKLSTEYTQEIAESLSRMIRKNADKIDTGELNDIIRETIHGQIPYQELIKLEREIVAFNLYDYIAEDFVARFCVMIY